MKIVLVVVLVVALEEMPSTTTRTRTRNQLDPGVSPHLIRNFDLGSVAISLKIGCRLEGKSSPFKRPITTSRISILERYL
jgi:hypothetical protein